MKYQAFNLGILGQYQGGAPNNRGPTIGETALVVKEDVVTNLPLVKFPPVSRQTREFYKLFASDRCLDKVRLLTGGPKYSELYVGIQE